MLQLTEEELAAMAAADICEVDINSLTDLRDITIDTELPVEERIASFAEQTKNVYIHRIGDYIVKVKFQEEGPTMDDRLMEYARHLSEGYI